MNEMSSLEKQLRGWVPRRPSTRLKERVFGRPPAVTAPVFTPAWLASALGCAVLLLAASSQRNPARATGSGGVPGLFALISSTQGFPAAWSGSLAAGRNAPRADTFEWTNANGSGPNMGFPSPLKAND